MAQSDVLQEFNDQNQHRSYPLIDAAGGVDVTNTFTLPTSFLVDIYMCAPNLANVDVCLFYISNITVRRFFIDVTISYDDPAVTGAIGTFKNIDTSNPINSTYEFTPFQIQSNDSFTPLYHMTGQITIGDVADVLRYLGSWNFSPSDNVHSTYITGARIAKGLLNVQYISINGRIFTGVVKLKEGSNLTFEIDQEVVSGTIETTITLNASLNSGSNLQINNDEDMLNALTNQFGVPIQKINGMVPSPTRNFTFFGADCSAITTGDSNLSISNPCATPCCDEDVNIANLQSSVSGLNLRYAQLKGFFDASKESINNIQNKLLSLGSDI
jgi:hypothetical protein